MIKKKKAGDRDNLTPAQSVMLLRSLFYRRQMPLLMRVNASSVLQKMLQF